MFLNGTAMSGQPDHHAVDGATFIAPATTAPRYRLLAIGDRFPGLLPVDDGGASIVGELYELSEAILFDSLLPAEPPELELGTIELSDGEIVNSMQLQTDRIRGDDQIVDISALGGWRTYQRLLLDNQMLPELLGRNCR